VVCVVKLNMALSVGEVFGSFTELESRIGQLEKRRKSVTMETRQSDNRKSESQGFEAICEA